MTCEAPVGLLYKLLLVQGEKSCIDKEARTERGLEALVMS